jgi:hypothetical protein
MEVFLIHVGTPKVFMIVQNVLGGTLVFPDCMELTYISTA